VESEDVQNQGGPIQYPDLFAECLFQLALVTREQLVVEGNDIGLHVADEYLDFFDLTGADVGGSIGVGQPLDGFANDNKTGGVGQSGKFGQTFFNGQERPFSC
jgi:hypothetical protein